MNLESPPRSRVWLEIDTKAIRENLGHIRQKVAPAQIMAVLKADGYGLGSSRVAQELLGVADRFGVAELKEAEPLVRLGETPVQIMGGLLPSEIADCVALGVICPVGDLRTAQLLSREAVRVQKRVKVHLKIDSGMGRLGIPIEEAESCLPSILALPGLDFEGIYSHFPAANQPEIPKSSQQIKAFRNLVLSLAQQGHSFPLVHIANSDAINNLPASYASESGWTMVRTGINLYGVFDLQGLRSYQLSPSLSLKTRLIAKRKLAAGSTIGYGCSYRLDRETWVGTIPAGYADGIPLAMSRSGKVLIGGQFCRIIGQISMDYLTVDLTPAMQSEPGSVVTLIGGSAGKQITVEEWAQVKQTHPYDIICSLGHRVERIYR